MTDKITYGTKKVTLTIVNKMTAESLCHGYTNHIKTRCPIIDVCMVQRLIRELESTLNQESVGNWSICIESCTIA